VDTTELSASDAASLVISKLGVKWPVSVVAARPTTHFNRSANSVASIRQLGWLVRLSPRPVNSSVGHSSNERHDILNNSCSCSKMVVSNHSIHNSGVSAEAEEAIDQYEGQTVE